MNSAADLALEAIPPRRLLSPRQKEVLDVVERVFLREGIQAVRMGQLAAEASCSRSTLYGLATSKEDLLLLVLDRLMRRFMRHASDAIDAAEGPVNKIRALMTSGAWDFGALGPHFVEAVRRYPPAKLLFDRRVSEGLLVLRALVDQATVEGDFRPVNSAVVAEAILGVVMRFTDPEFVRVTQVSTASGLEQLIEIMIAGLRP